VTPTPNCAVPATEPPQQPAGQQPDPALAAAVDIARAAAAGEAGAEQVGRHVGVEPELDGAATHLFDAELPGYRGWRWAATVASAGVDTPVTVSEVVLLPGPDALTAPEWVPWQQRVQAGDLGVGDLMPTAPEDPRLAPGYLASDDEAVEEVALELGLGRVRVLSRFGRLDSAERWQTGDFGPRSDMARGAPDRCGRCGFYLPVAGSLRAAFGVCANELSPADGRVVHVEYGCGAHSEVELEITSPVPVVDLVYDSTTLDVEVSVRQAPPVEAPVTEVPGAEPVDAEAVDPEVDVEASEPAPAATVTAPDEPTQEADPADVAEQAEPVEPAEQAAEASPSVEPTLEADEADVAEQAEPIAPEVPDSEVPDSEASEAQASEVEASEASGSVRSDEPAPPASDV
jgi:hypothetical protein